MNIVNEMELDLMIKGLEWCCPDCGVYTYTYTDEAVCYYCITGEEPMNNVVTFEFYSDTNLSNALDELQSMSLDVLNREATVIMVGSSDYNEMGDSIEAIIEANGGVLLVG